MICLALTAAAPRAAMADDPRQQLQAVRQAARAYEGAPPTIPHWYDPMDTDACLQCHTTGADVGYGRPAPLTPHAEWLACTQCHVTRAAPETPGPATSVTGLGLSASIHRAYLGAPPVVPHPLAGREKCVTCHAGPGTPRAIRTSHPERESCLQCHAIDASRQPLGP